MIEMIVLFSSLVLLAFFHARLQEAAIARRARMVDAVADIINNDKISERAKGVALVMFEQSLNPWMPFVVLRRFIFSSDKKTWMREISKTDIEAIDGLVKKHFLPVNAIAALPSFVFVMFLFTLTAIVYSLFRSLTGLNKAHIKHRMTGALAA